MKSSSLTWLLADFWQFRQPTDSAAHLSNCSALILRIGIRSIGLDNVTRESCKILLSRFIHTLQAHYSSAAWDVATSTLDRTANLVKSAEEVLPEMKELVEACKVDEGAAGTLMLLCDRTRAIAQRNSFEPS